MASGIVMTYYYLIKKGLKNIDQVPENIRNEVKELLDAES
jgi:hypothetical protein